MGILPLILVPMLAVVAQAQDFPKLKANSIHCATAGAVATAEVYPLAKTHCAIVASEWGLLDEPEEVQPGVLKVNMGLKFGVRYVKSSSVQK